MAYNSVARRSFRACALALWQAICGIYFCLKMVVKVGPNSHGFVRAKVLLRECCTTRPASQVVDAPTGLQRCDR